MPQDASILCPRCHETTDFRQLSAGERVLCGICFRTMTIQRAPDGVMSAWDSGNPPPRTVWARPTKGTTGLPLEVSRQPENLRVERDELKSTGSSGYRETRVEFGGFTAERTRSSSTFVDWFRLLFLSLQFVAFASILAATLFFRGLTEIGLLGFLSVMLYLLLHNIRLDWARLRVSTRVSLSNGELTVVRGRRSFSLHVGAIERFQVQPAQEEGRFGPAYDLSVVLSDGDRMAIDTERPYAEVRYLEHRLNVHLEAYAA